MQQKTDSRGDAEHDEQNIAIEAGQPTHDKGLAELGAFLEAAVERAQRSALKSVSAVHAQLAARVYALEQLITRQQYAQALDLIPLLLADVDQAKEESTKGIARRA